jgi:hypothetical protein
MFMQTSGDQRRERAEVYLLVVLANARTHTPRPIDEKMLRDTLLNNR